MARMFELAEQGYGDADAEWDAFVAAHPHGSVLQTTNWARLKNRFGWSSHRVWLKKDGRLVAGAQILFRSAALGIVKLAYVPHGPLVDWHDTEQVEVLFNQLDLSAYERGAGILKLEPYLWQTELPSWTELCQRTESLAAVDTVQPPRTILLDLSRSEEAILADMKQKTRYNIRLAFRKGVEVRQGSAEDIPAFVQLLTATAARDQFASHAPDYYRVAYDLFSPEQATLLLAEYAGRPLAGVMIFVNGETAAYLYGASSNEERQRMPNHAIQWAAIRWARSRGCRWYDFWGVPDAEPEELEAGFMTRRDGLWPVYRFKRGFGGRVVRTVGAADRVYNQRVNRLYRWWRRRQQQGGHAGQGPA